MMHLSITLIATIGTCFAVELFIANEGVVSLDELAACFPSTKNPRKRVPDIIHWLNQALAKHGIDLRVNRDVMFSVGRSTDPTCKPVPEDRSVPRPR